MSSQLAVQMYTVREFTKKGSELSETLRKVRQIGYTAVQFSAIQAMDWGTGEVSAAEARRMLDDNGLRCIATHRSWDRLVQATEEEIALHKALGCDYVAIGGLPARYAQAHAEGYARFIIDAEPVIAALKSEGIRFGYHNHEQEFVRIGPGQRTLYDLFVEAGPDFTLEIDVYWAVHAGINPVRLFERCVGRVPVIHAKDKEVVAGAGPVMAPVGEGNLDWEGLLPACASAGVEWYAIEQDEYRRDPFDCLRSSFEFLTAHGL